MRRISSSTRALRAIAALLLLAAMACGGGDLTGPLGRSANIPVVGMNPGEFGFAITARDWSASQSYSPDLQVGSLQVGLAVAGYVGGSGSISVIDATGAAVFTANIAGNIAAGNNTTIRGTPPFQVRVTASHYTGIVSLGVNGARSPQ